MKRSACLLLSLVALVRTAFAADDGDALIVQFESFPTDAPVMAALFDGPDAFDAREPAHRAMVGAARAAHHWSITDLPAGDYAVLAFIDENGNGLLDRSARGRPQEMYAISGRSSRGAPRFERARVIHAGGETTIRVGPWRGPRKRNLAGASP